MEKGKGKKRIGKARKEIVICALFIGLQAGALRMNNNDYNAKERALEIAGRYDPEYTEDDLASDTPMSDQRLFLERLQNVMI